MNIVKYVGYDGLIKRHSAVISNEYKTYIENS